MVVAPKEKPVIENLNAYYLNIPKLLEHFQGEIGAGSIVFRSNSVKGIIYFDHDDVLGGCIQDRAEKTVGKKAVKRLMAESSDHNFMVNIYQIPPEDIYFWSSLPTADMIYSDLSTEFTDLQGLLRKMTTEKLTGFIDVNIGDGSEQGLIFISNGEIVGGSFSWERGKAGSVKKEIGKLVEKTKKSGGLFQVSRIPMNDKDRSSADGPRTAPGPELLEMLEEYMVIFDRLYASQKVKDGDLNTIIRKKFVEKAEKYAFLDPFAAEFEYKNGKIHFIGEAHDEDLAAAVLSSMQELAQELGIEEQFKQHLSSWSGKHKKRLDKLGVLS